MSTYFFLLAFSAALVAFPATSLGVVACREKLFIRVEHSARIINHLDDTDSNSLPHVPNGEPSKGRVVGEGLHAHGLAGEQLHDGSVSGLDELGRVLSGLAGTPVNLLQDLCKLASDVRCVAV